MQQILVAGSAWNPLVTPPKGHLKVPVTSGWKSFETFGDLEKTQGIQPTARLLDAVSSLNLGRDNPPAAALPTPSMSHFLSTQLSQVHDGFTSCRAKT